jgi:hypothetical protein
MSWDLFIQDLPVAINSIEEIPPDFQPQPILPRTRILEVVKELVPTADFSDPKWWRIDAPEFSIEINIGPEDPSNGFALHIRGGEHVLGFVHELLTRLGVRALDPSSDSGLFDMEKSRAGFEKWIAYRNLIVRQDPQ